MPSYSARAMTSSLTSPSPLALVVTTRTSAPASRCARQSARTLRGGPPYTNAGAKYAHTWTMRSVISGCRVEDVIRQSCCQLLDTPHQQPLVDQIHEATEVHHQRHRSAERFRPGTFEEIQRQPEHDGCHRNR